MSPCKSHNLAHRCQACREHLGCVEIFFVITLSQGAELKKGRSSCVTEVMLLRQVAIIRQMVTLGLDSLFIEMNLELVDVGSDIAAPHIAGKRGLLHRE